GVISTLTSINDMMVFSPKEEPVRFYIGISVLIGFYILLTFFIWKSDKKTIKCLMKDNEDIKKEHGYVQTENMKQKNKNARLEEKLNKELNKDYQLIMRIGKIEIGIKKLAR